MRQDVKVVVAIPTLDKRIHTACIDGLLQTWGSIRCMVVWIPGSFIARQRDRAVRMFLNTDFTHLLMVDSDMAWRYHHLELLLELEEDFTFGRYTDKTGKNQIMAAGLNPEFAAHSRTGDALKQEATACGTGFVLVSRNCVEQMVKAAEHDEYRDVDGSMLHNLFGTVGMVYRPDEDLYVAEGEDFAFCRRWRNLGGKIYTRSDMLIGHVGEKVYP